MKLIRAIICKTLLAILLQYPFIHLYLFGQNIGLPTNISNIVLQVIWLLSVYIGIRLDNRFHHAENQIIIEYLNPIFAVLMLIGIVMMLPTILKSFISMIQDIYPLFNMPVHE